MYHIIIHSVESYKALLDCYQQEMGINCKWVWLLLILESWMWTKCDAAGGDRNNTNTTTIVSSIKAKLNTIPQISSDLCIFRVLTSFRELKKEAYAPEIVSIGPFHRDTQSLQYMQVYKLRYLNNLLHKRQEKSIEYYVGELRGLEERARECYSEKISLTSDEFVEMMLIDGVFIIEFMVEYNSWNSDGINDSVITSLWLLETTVGDMELIENQLPFFVIEHLFNLLSAPDNKYQDFTLLEHTLMLFGNDLSGGRDDLAGHEIKNFVDLFQQYYAPSPRTLPKHPENFQFIPPATELHETGMQFRSKGSGYLLDVSFTRKKGVLHIPRLRITDSTDIFLRNVMVFQQFNKNLRVSYITDYVTLLDSLINTADDVALLRESGVIDNWLGSDEDVASMLNSLGRDTFMYADTFYYAALFEDVNAYYKKRWNLWITKLRRDYFNTPWSTISFVAATIVVICGLIQTYLAWFPKQAPITFVSQWAR